MFINKINGVSSNIGFKSVNNRINDVGENIKRFSYNYDNKNGNESCEIHIFKVTKLDNHNYKVDKTPIYVLPLTPEGAEINLQSVTDLDKDEAFAYKVVRKNKQGNIVWEGADTGVKMHELSDGIYGFRDSLDKVGDSKKYQPLDDRGKPKTIYDDKGELIKNPSYSYTTSKITKPEDEKKWEYTLVTQKGTTPLTQGLGYLAMPDTFMPGMRYKGFNEEGTGELLYDANYQKKMEGMVKTVSNMYGGNIAGLEAFVPELKKLGVKKFFTTPLANGDNRTSHGYYNKNNMQVPENMGNSENYDSLMKAEFKNGMSHVFDATLTSEGIEGIHVRYALRWGDKSQTAKWFRMSGLKDAGIGFGVVPNEANNLRHRIVNAPYKYEKQSNGTYKKVVNNDYKPNQETLLQIYDASQVSQEQLSQLDKPIDMYRELNAGKNLDITSYDDTTISYVFEINPNEYDKNINNINDLIKKEGKNIELNSPEGTIIASNMSNFHINRMSDGYVAWDDNADMVKLNYGISAFDEKDLQNITDRAERQHEQELRIRASKETQDIAIQSLKYWAEKTSTAHTIYTAQTLGKIKSADKINQLISEGKLPELPEGKEISQKIVENILNGEYNLSSKGILNKDDVTVKSLMKMPLDALEFGENTVGVLSTSYFSNRATTDNTIGISRFDLMKQNNPHLVDTYAKVYNKVNGLFTNELKDFADSVIKKVNEKSNEPLITSDGNYTEYGEYVMDLLGKNITKYALLKSLSGDSFKYKILSDGTLTYDYNNIKQATTLKALGINASNPTEEAELLQDKIQKGLKTLSLQDIDVVAESISKTIKDTDTNTFRLSEAFINRAGLELDFRLDAAKDVMDWDSVRNRDADFDDTWTNLINFWSKIVQGIKSVDPHAYIVAEMTDIPDVMRDTFGGENSCPYNGWTNVNGVKYNGEPDAMTKFFNETGITSEAAYSYFFTELLTSFSRDFERGENKCDTHDDFKQKYDILINTRSADYLRNLYTFVGNHDKTRSIHGLAVDMELFHSTLQHDSNDFSKNHKQRLDAARVLSGAKNTDEIPLELKLNADNLNYFRTVSARAVAQTKLLMDSVDNDLNGIASKDDVKLLREALIDLANGNYLKNKATDKMTRINLPELSSLENAIRKVVEIARKNGASISEAQVNQIIQKAKALDTNNYLVHGDFDWSNEIGEQNRNYLGEILDNYGNANDYSLYTVQIARMIKDASKDSSNAVSINNALKDFVKTYNREKVRKNMDEFKMYEDFATARKKNSYAAKDFRVALEEAFAQAEFKSGRKISNKENIIAAVYNSVTEPAIKKHAMMLSFLSGFCGIPTIFAGDEYGDTGYEDKSKNPIVGNRMASRRSELENDTIMGRIMNKYKNITYDAQRHKAEIKPLRNGSPYSMDVMVNGRNRDEVLARISEIDAICNHLTKGSRLEQQLRQEQNALRLHLAKVAFMMLGDDGDMAISVFNAAGIDHGNRVNYYEKYGLHTKSEREKFIRDNNIETINPNNPYIPIQQKTEMDAILMGAGVAIPLGTIFINADSRDKTKYIVKEINNRIGIVRADGKKIIMDGLTAKNGTMILRKLKNIAFRGSQNTYNQQYNIVSNPYGKTTEVKTGKALSVISQ